jgi:hypothetical protein
VIWYLGVPAVLLGAFGLAVLAKRTTRALLTWKDPTAAARVWALPLMMAIWAVVTVLYRPAVPRISRGRAAAWCRSCCPA